MKRQEKEAGYTLVEISIGAAVSSVVLLGLVLGSISLQRSFAGADHYATAQDAQMRVMNYLTRDLRRAGGIKGLTRTTVTAPDGTAISFDSTDSTTRADGSANSFPVALAADGTWVMVAVPDYYSAYDSNGNPSTRSTVNSQPNDPVISSGSPVYGSNMVIITYYVNSTTQTLVRQINWTASGVAKSSQTTIADGVQNFQLSFNSYSNSVIKATITFAPILQRNTTATARAGTTLSGAVTLRDAPLS